jgi:hypothetical protein
LRQDDVSSPLWHLLDHKGNYPEWVDQSMIFPPETLLLKEKLGSGDFGFVFKGHYKHGDARLVFDDCKIIL